MSCSSPSFLSLGVPALFIKNLSQACISSPKPIQEQAISGLIEGRDVLGIAQTGSGKTLAFLLPLLSKILPLGDKRIPRTARALVLVPTRELALQIQDTVKIVLKDSHLSCAVILGGASRLVQMKRMQPGVDILIATPGRLLDLQQEGLVDLRQTKFFVLDEADRMLDMGFIQPIRKIASLIAPEHQTALFSATMPKEICSLAHSLLKNPLVIETAEQSTTVAEITQQLYAVPTRQKKKVLAAFLQQEGLSSTIVFTRTKYGADAVARFLVKQGLAARAIHGNKTQNARQSVLKDFRSGAITVLVATDIVARGIDVQGISHVINYDLPDEGESYVHRIGRTGRNGASGVAITLYDAAVEHKRLRSIERATRQKFSFLDLPKNMALLLQEDIKPPTHQAEANKKPFSKEGKAGKRPRFSTRARGDAKRHRSQPSL